MNAQIHLLYLILI